MSHEDLKNTIRQRMAKKINVPKKFDKYAWMNRSEDERMAINKSSHESHVKEKAIRRHERKNRTSKEEYQKFVKLMSRDR